MVTIEPLRDVYAQVPPRPRRQYVLAGADVQVSSNSLSKRLRIPPSGSTSYVKCPSIVHLPDEQREFKEGSARRQNRFKLNMPRSLWPRPWVRVCSMRAQFRRMALHQCSHAGVDILCLFELKAVFSCSASIFIRDLGRLSCLSVCVYSMVLRRSFFVGPTPWMFGALREGISVPLHTGSVIADGHWWR